MKTISGKILAAVTLIGVLGSGGYVLANRVADEPACCQSKQACCPSQSCCKGGSHGAQCPMPRHA